MRSEIEENKPIQRLTGQKAREALSPEDRERYSRIVSKKLIAHPAVRDAAVIFSYMAFGAELDLDLFHAEAVKQGKVLAFPVTDPAGSMEAYRPCCPDDWVRGPFGICTPRIEASVHTPPETIDVVIVPCVAFDDSRMRIGWGGGYYDRYLVRCSKARIIGVAFEAQRLQHVAAEPGRDFRLDEVITEADFR